MRKFAKYFDEKVFFDMGCFCFTGIYTRRNAGPVFYVQTGGGNIFKIRSLINGQEP